uniref:Fungal lipase-type domain-containing protein n=1 Tax=Oryza meridionalis TaxID=40149 RepID=A0A0E0FEE2_9ORYZ
MAGGEDKSSLSAGRGRDEAADHKPPPVVCRAELVRYARMADVAYAAFAGEENLPHLLVEGGVGDYVATTHLYATIDAVLKAFEVFPVLNGVDKPYWFGYVAVARRGGRRWDIAVAWRGSVTVADWMMNVHINLVPFKYGGGAAGKVAEGFYSVYTSSDPSKEHGELSAREQVVGEVLRLVDHFRRQDDHSSQKKKTDVRVTVTGHSLGGALALMSAHDVAAKLAIAGHGDVPVHAVTFGSPHVGDMAFRGALRGKHVGVVRVAVKQDVVPRLPMGDGYVEVGDRVVELDVDRSPLKLGSHNIDLYLHLIGLLRDCNEVSPAASGESSAPADKKRKWPEMKEKSEHGYMRVPLSDLDKLEVTRFEADHDDQNFPNCGHVSNDPCGN